MVTETDLKLSDGRTLHAYDTGANDAVDRLAVFWHHGSLNVGAPPEPLFPAAEELGIRWVSYDRPGYGGSTPRPDRGVASAAGTSGLGGAPMFGEPWCQKTASRPSASSAPVSYTCSVRPSPSFRSVSVTTRPV